MRYTLHFLVRPGRRRGRWHFFAPDAVPPFDGEAALFECERVPGGWRVLRLVEVVAGPKP